MAGVKFVKSGDVLEGVWLARDTVERGKRLPCSLDSEPRDVLDIVVESHRLVFPERSGGEPHRSVGRAPRSWARLAAYCIPV